MSVRVKVFFFTSAHTYKSKLTIYKPIRKFVGVSCFLKDVKT